LYALYKMAVKFSAEFVINVFQWIYCKSFSSRSQTFLVEDKLNLLHSNVQDFNKWLLCYVVWYYNFPKQIKILERFAVRYFCQNHPVLSGFSAIVFLGDWNAGKPSGSVTAFLSASAINPAHGPPSIDSRHLYLAKQFFCRCIRSRITHIFKISVYIILYLLWLFPNIRQHMMAKIKKRK